MYCNPFLGSRTDRVRVAGLRIIRPRLTPPPGDRTLWVPGRGQRQSTAKCLPPGGFGTLRPRGDLLAQVRLASVDRPSRLLDRLGFDAALEAAAFRRLAERDLEGCRATFGRLIEGLNLRGRRDHAPALLLLLDVLQQVNRRVHHPATDGALCQARRGALIRQFAAYDTPEQARAEFLPTLARLLAPLTPRERSTHPLVERARALIDDRYNRRLSLSSVAEVLHVSANYLSRLFRRETGMTLTAYNHRVRLEHALLLLAEGDRSISEIAYLVGYQNYRDFYRNFVKYEHASPREVQRRLAPAAADC